MRIDKHGNLIPLYMSPEEGGASPSGPGGSGGGAPPASTPPPIPTTLSGVVPPAPAAPETAKPERPVRRFIAPPRQPAAPSAPASPTAPATPATPATPVTPVTPAAPQSPATAELAQRLARIEAAQRVEANKAVFSDLVAATAVKTPYIAIVEGLVRGAVGEAADYSDPAVKAKVAATIDAIQGTYTEMFGPKVERAQSQSEWAKEFAKARTEQKLPANSIAGRMSAAQLENVLKGGR